MSAAVEEFWARFVAATGATASYRAGSFAEEFPDVATELGLLVRDGPKRATTSRLSEYQGTNEPMPAVGDHWVVTDGEGHPLCVTRTTRVDVARFGDVDEAFAWDEGEGDRTLAWWRQAHLDYFAATGQPVDDDTPVVLERFEVVWPT
jgi:uncharacterized protein YhfF